jgi:hypothetical protein
MSLRLRGQGVSNCKVAIADRPYPRPASRIEAAARPQARSVAMYNGDLPLLLALTAVRRSERTRLQPPRFRVGLAAGTGGCEEDNSSRSTRLVCVHHLLVRTCTAQAASPQRGGLPRIVSRQGNTMSPRLSRAGVPALFGSSPGTPLPAPPAVFSAAALRLLTPGHRSPRLH